VQPAESGRLPRARIADLRLRGREHARRARQKLGLDPIDFRLKNIARPGTRCSPAASSPTRLRETLQALQKHPAYKSKLGKNQGRGVACGYWFNGGGESSATVHVNEDGTVVVATGSPDIGGSRASMALMAAETLGIDYERCAHHRRHELGRLHPGTGGSRVTFATGMTVINACNKPRRRTVRPRRQDLEDRPCRRDLGERPCAPGTAAVRATEPLSLKAIAAKRGGHRRADHGVGLGQRRRPGARLFRTQFCDVEVDTDTGHVKILRYVAPRTSAGRSTRPMSKARCRAASCRASAGRSTRSTSTTRGPAGKPGIPRLSHPRVLRCADDRSHHRRSAEPVHPFGVKGVAEANIVPPMAAIANAIDKATGKRLTDLPMSPPKVLAALDAG
jgi:CO/xanthine dehydrogenase Mo-binding subunit